MDLIETLTGVTAQQVRDAAERAVEFDWGLTPEQREALRLGVQSSG